MTKTILIGVAGLVVGLIAGYFLGRSMLEREWSQPNMIEKLSAADAQRSTGKDADPVPKAGSKILKKAPLARARQVMAEFTKQDPLKVTFADVGNGEDSSDLNIYVKNTGRCTVSSFSGIAYGYDAYGKPAKMNKGGEFFVAFSEEKVEDLEPGKTHAVGQSMHHTETASLAVAQVDEFTCTDGTKWARN